MDKQDQQKLSESRRLLQNPYAYISGSGKFDAKPRVMEATAVQISADKRLLGNQYAHEDGSGRRAATIAAAKLNADSSLRKKPSPLSKETRQRRVEQAVRDLHKKIWSSRNEIWPNGVPSDPVELLDPEIACELEGYDFGLAESLGQYSTNGASFEVAGLIDRPTKRVQISRQMPFMTRRFTAAHELGHVLLHQDMRMHRDRPLDGSGQERGSRDRIEFEADKFASLFLMPERLVRKRFRQIFLCDKFLLNEDSVFSLDPLGSLGLQDGNKSLRELARILAKVENYNGRFLKSLAEQFSVSVEAMAIRLEELELLEV